MFPLTLKTPHGVISGNVTKTLIYEGVYNFNTALRPVEMGPVQKALNRDLKGYDHMCGTPISPAAPKTHFGLYMAFILSKPQISESFL